MIQIYADGDLIHDSRIYGHDLMSLKIKHVLNKGGTAEITMPPEHPAYSRFVSFRTIVTIYNNGELRFRGRALYPKDNYRKERTVTCEGELCLFQDSVICPGYQYTDAPAGIFRALVAHHNAQTDDFKQFVIGECTVTDANETVTLENGNPSTVLDALNRLLDRCGGYFIFDTDADGNRLINWRTSLDKGCNQKIEFGENLLDFSSTEAGTDLATGIYPLGAKTNDGEGRLSISLVNQGKRYIVDEEAQAIRGTIMTYAIWDDVTDPEILLQKAQEYLQEYRNIVTSIEISAMDLSHLNKSLDTFTVGEVVRVSSKPHCVEENFLLTEMTEDLVNPAKSVIKLGKNLLSLSGGTAAAGATKPSTYGTGYTGDVVVGDKTLVINDGIITGIS